MANKVTEEKNSNKIKECEHENGRKDESENNHRNEEKLCGKKRKGDTEKSGDNKKSGDTEKSGECIEQDNNSVTEINEKDADRGQNVSLNDIDFSGLQKNKRWKAQTEKEMKKSKRVRNKDFCYFCESLVLNFGRHIKNAHSYEVEVQKILSKPINSKERKDLITNLRKRGNYLNSKDHFKPMKKPNIPKSQNDYLACEFCLGLYAAKQLWRHKKICPGKPKGNEKITNAFRFKLCVDRDLQEKVFPTMRLDEVSLVAKKDPLICAFGARYLKIHRETHFINVTSRKMRELSKILIELKKIEPSIQTLFHALIPKFYDHLVTATKIIAKYDPEKRIFESPTFAMNISTSLKQCCDIAITYALKKKDIYANVATAEAESDLKTLIQILEANWRYDISTEASNHLNMQKWNKITIVPLASDLKLLKEHLCEKAESAALNLQSNTSDCNSYNILMETIFCRVILLNRKRPGELQRLLLDTYKNSEIGNNKNYEEFSDAVSPTEKILMKKFKRIVIRGKRDRGVPVLFAPDVQEHIKILLNARENCIGKNNIYFFSNTNNIGKPIVGYKVLAHYAYSCGAKNPKALTSTRLRKHLATLSQLFNMSENDLEQLSTFMGHTPGVHKKSYRLPDDVYQTAKLTKILLLMEKGTAAEFKGKSFDEIAVDMDEDLLVEDAYEENNIECPAEMEEIESTADRSEPTSSSHKNSKYTKIERERWTEEQKIKVKLFFENHIRTKRPPKERECKTLISQYPDLLHNKNWKKIKVFVQNLYSKKK